MPVSRSAFCKCVRLRSSDDGDAYLCPPFIGKPIWQPPVPQPKMPSLIKIASELPLFS
jgi:hypothetical protein